MEALAEKAHGNERDYVREEIAAALKRDIVVIPVLVGQEGRMPPLPRVGELPDDIRDLVMHQRHSITHESFGRDVDDLVTAINSVRRAARPVSWNRLAWAAAAIALAVVASAISYRSDILAWLQLPRPGLVEEKPDKPDLARRAEEPAAPSRAESRSANATTAHESAKKAAEDAARKQVEQAQLNLVTECDHLAASPTDKMRPYGITGVEYEKINGEEAWSCNNAMRDYPEVTRFVFQAGRAAGVRSKHIEAADLYFKAASRGSPAAMNNLGHLYLLGEGVTVNYAEARKWFENAAALGNASAMTSLGFLYDKGQGVDRDYAEARRWYEQATSLGDPNGTNNLGALYENGNGVVRNYEEARKWYERAAALGYADAMFNLGNLYADGRGVAKNVKLAREWYQRAADGGHKEAKEKLASLK